MTENGRLGTEKSTLVMSIEDFRKYNELKRHFAFRPSEVNFAIIWGLSINLNHNKVTWEQ